MAKQPFLSIIITSYTAERLKDIFELLDSIKSQTYPNIETIFVAEHSRELYERVKAYVHEGNILNMKVIFSSDKLGISGARNLGVKYANGSIIAFVDDDAVLFLNWAEEIVKALEHRNDIIGVTGPVFPLWESKSLEWFPEEFYWMIGCTAWKDAQTGTCEAEYAPGVNMTFKREAFNATLFRNLYSKGAHEEGKLGPVGDDREFCLLVKRKTGKRILYSSSVKVFHKVRAYKITSRFIRRYAYWQGYSDAMFKDKLKATHERLKTEYDLLRRTISRLIPSITREFMVNRNSALKKLKVTVETLLYFSFGYLSYIIPGLIVLTRKLV